LAGLLCAGAALAAAPVNAAELSFVSGLYRAEKDKVGGASAGKKSTIDVGGRFGDQLDQRWAWLAQGLLSLKSYGSGASGESPSDSTSLSAGGGLRYSFTKLGEAITPFALGLAEYRNDKDAEIQANGDFDETETSGLFYGAHAGLRIDLDKDFFLDLETELFESALFATAKTESTTFTTAGKVTTKSETTRTELYANTAGAFDSTLVALGLKF
jgi:hypothetical protein